MKMDPTSHGLDFTSAKKWLCTKGFIKDGAKMKQTKLNLVTVDRDSSFPSSMQVSNIGLYIYTHEHVGIHI